MKFDPICKVFTALILAYWMHRDTMMRSTITSCCSMMMPRSVSNSWKHPSSCMASILTVCHQLGMFGMLWIGVYNSVFHLLPIFSNFAQPFQDELTNIPQATINNLINSVWIRCVALCEANSGHTRYWLIFWAPATKTAHFRVALISILIYHICEVGWIISVK